MDHVRWCESNIAAGKSLATTAKDIRKGKEGIGFLAAPDKLNDFQRRAITILGIVGNGIYNAPIVWNSIQWNPRFICVTWWGTLSTFDFVALTQLVLLAHEARIRATVAPKSFKYLELRLHEKSHVGGYADRHPSIEEAVAGFRAAFGEDHPVRYPMPERLPEIA